MSELAGLGFLQVCIPQNSLWCLIRSHFWQCLICVCCVNSVYEKRKLILQPLLQWGINSLPFLPGHLISWKLLEQNLSETFKTLSNLVENGQAFQKLQVRRNSSQLCEHTNFFCLENWDKNRLWYLSPAIGYQSIKATTEK